MERDYSAWGVASGGQLLAAACGALIRRECYKVGNDGLIPKVASDLAVGLVQFG